MLGQQFGTWIPLHLNTLHKVQNKKNKCIEKKNISKTQTNNKHPGCSATPQSLKCFDIHLSLTPKLWKWCQKGKFYKSWVRKQVVNMSALLSSAREEIVLYGQHQSISFKLGIFSLGKYWNMRLWRKSQ